MQINGNQGFGFVLKHTPSHVAEQHKKARSILIFATLIEKARDDLLITLNPNLVGLFRDLF